MDCHAIRPIAFIIVIIIICYDIVYVMIPSSLWRMSWHGMAFMHCIEHEDAATRWKEVRKEACMHGRTVTKDQTPSLFYFSSAYCSTIAGSSKNNNKLKLDNFER